MFAAAGAGGVRLRLRFASEPGLTTGDRIGVWGDLIGDDLLVSRHIVVPPEETSLTSALIGAYTVTSSQTVFSVTSSIRTRDVS